MPIDLHWVNNRAILLIIVNGCSLLLGSIAGAVGATAVYPIDLGRNNCFEMIDECSIVFCYS